MNKKHLLILGVALVLIVSLILTIPPRLKTWRHTEEIVRDGMYTSETFTMENPWRVKWSYTNNSKLTLFFVQVMEKSTVEWHLSDSSFLDSNSTEGIITIDHGGIFYLNVFAIGRYQWWLIIEEFY